MDLHAEQLLEILNQPGVIQQTPARFPGDQQIEVAVLIGFAAGHGAEHTQAVGASPPGELEDFLPPFRPQSVHGDHVSIVRQIRRRAHPVRESSRCAQARTTKCRLCALCLLCSQDHEALPSFFELFSSLFSAFSLRSPRLCGEISFLPLDTNRNLQYSNHILRYDAW